MVVFPIPEGPNKQTISPSLLISKVTLFTLLDFLLCPQMELSQGI